MMVIIKIRNNLMFDKFLTTTFLTIMLTLILYVQVILRMLSIAIFFVGNLCPITSLLTTGFSNSNKMIVKKSLISFSRSLPQEATRLERSIKGAVTRSVALSLTGNEHALLALLADSSTSITAVSILRPSLDIFVNVLSFLFIVRTVLSWYPKTDLKAFPYSIAVWPTEPLLEPVRDLVPPAFGVDVSSIVWIMLLSFVREVLTGQQGILTLIERS